jgi:hypothetical protein
MSVRINPRLAVYFGAAETPLYRDAALQAAHVEAQVKSWLASNPSGTVDYAFVDRWYAAFDSVDLRKNSAVSLPRAVGPQPLEPPAPRPEDFGLTAEQVRLLGLNPPVALRQFAAVLIFAICGTIVARWWWFLWLYVFVAWFVLLGSLVGIGYYVPVVWRRRHLDSEILRSYERYRRALGLHRDALSAYRAQLSGWQQRKEKWERSQLAFWRGLPGRSFERELANLLAERGFQVQLTPPTNDGGVDLILRKGRRAILVQCKAHKSLIGPGPVRDLYGTFKHAGGSEAWLVTTSGFTGGARRFAQAKPLRLITILDLLKGDL